MTESTVLQSVAVSPLVFRFVEFNERRHMRGAPAARVAVIDDGEEDWLWMTKKDITLNMKMFGQDPELRKALEAYP